MPTVTRALLQRQPRDGMLLRIETRPRPCMRTQANDGCTIALEREYPARGNECRYPGLLAATLAAEAVRDVLDHVYGMNTHTVRIVDPVSGERWALGNGDGPDSGKVGA